MKSSRQLSLEVAKAAEGKKARRVAILDIRRASGFADFFVICSGESTPQLKAIGEAIEEKLRRQKIRPRWEGELASGWVILDIGSVVVHIMGSAEREYYNLEDLWGPQAVTYHL